MIHPLTYVHPDAKIGPNVKIDPFTTIHKNVEIGEGTWIGSNVTIMEGARIGKNCRIFPSSVISAIPQDLKFKGEDTLCIIGDNTTIRECVTINRGTVDRNQTRIGNNCLIMAYTHIAHDCEVGNSCIFSNNTTLAGHIVVGDCVVLAGLTAVQQFVRIGSYAFVTGGSLVRKDIPPLRKSRPRAPQLCRCQLGRPQAPRLQHRQDQPHTRYIPYTLCARQIGRAHV